MKNVIKLILSIGVSLAAGAVGSIFTASSVSSWYQTLVQPDFAPPSWLFGPVWTLLYVLMGIALFLVWSSYAKASQDKQKGIRIAIVIFFVQLALNALWSFLFFGARNPQIAFFEIVFLWISIVASMFFFSKISRTATWLLVPYILWVSFAGYLNYSIMILN